MKLMCCKKLLGGLVCVRLSGHEGKCNGDSLLSRVVNKTMVIPEADTLENLSLGRALADALSPATRREMFPNAAETEEKALAAVRAGRSDIADQLLRNDSLGRVLTAAGAMPEPTFAEMYGGPAAHMPQSLPSGAFAKVSAAFANVAEAARLDAEAPHVQLKALAGTGKTTSCVEGLKHVKSIGASVTPSPQQEEFWKQLGLGRNESVRISAFNNSITDELKERLAACGLDKLGVEARGIHSLGNSAVYKQFGKMEVSEWATKNLVCEVLGKDYSEVKREKGMLVLVNAATELASLCKQNMCEPTPDELERLASHYDIDVESHAQQIAEVVPVVLERCKSPAGIIHFDDMVWLPLVLGLPVSQVDVQIIDEQQDLNRMQQELVYRGGRRVIGVGDEHQAIYGFAGADAESMQRMAATLAQTARGCVELPLTVTRRCAKSIVREAQKYVPEYEAHESNPIGVVDVAKYTTRKNPFTNQTEERPYKETYMPLVRDGAMILCRTNAPLVGQCFRFLKRGIKAQIMGKKIGEGLVALVEKSRIDDVPSFLAWLADWAQRETAGEEKKKFPSQTKLDLVRDKADCLQSFCEGQLRTSDVAAKIKSVFTDAKSVRGVRLSSIHKSKGLEAEQVFFLQPPGSSVRCKSDWQRKQEDNLQYVAITRAIRELFFVR